MLPSHGPAPARRRAGRPWPAGKRCLERAPVRIGFLAALHGVACVCDGDRRGISDGSRVREKAVAWRHTNVLLMDSQQQAEHKRTECQHHPKWLECVKFGVAVGRLGRGHGGLLLAVTHDTMKSGCLAVAAMACRGQYLAMLWRRSRGSYAIPGVGKGQHHPPRRVRASSPARLPAGHRRLTSMHARTPCPRSKEAAAGGAVGGSARAGLHLQGRLATPTWECCRRCASRPPEAAKRVRGCGEIRAFMVCNLRAGPSHSTLRATATQGHMPWAAALPSSRTSR